MTNLSKRLIYNSSKATPLLPHKHRFADTTCEEAYQKCVEYEHNISSGEETSKSLIRMLGYLISEAIHEGAQTYIAKQVIKYSTVNDGLLKLAHIYAEHVVGRFICKEDILSLPTYSEAARNEDPDYATLMILERLDSQDFQCPLTNATDAHHILSKREETRKRREEINWKDEGPVGHLRCVHILPRFEPSDLDLIVDQNPPNGPPLFLKDIWDNYFYMDLKRLVYSERTLLYHSTANTIALESDTAALFNIMDLWLDRTTNPETYQTDFAFDVALDVARLTQREQNRYNAQVVFKTMIIPHGAFLKIHACMARICAWSGVKRYLEHKKAEAEDELWDKEAEEEMAERNAKAGGRLGHKSESNVLEQD
ncbi:hypothetical protein CVT24_013238 [Panaeolus cyanescens]|uniref:Uncharacterized protein n=1 Tax=Panaeolus cyanescens TaxID=181874 RepID=A0A409WAM5_9AGAR|nr:hypothetical protein CVT24_013238 [Panaeolus cyanescens]